VRRLDRDQFRKIRRLRSSKNFISEREKLVHNINAIHGKAIEYSTQAGQLPVAMTVTGQLHVGIHCER